MTNTPEERNVMYFDRVVERQINGKFIVFAINTTNDQAYPLTNVIVQTSDSFAEGLRLSISSHPMTYAYTEKFQSSEELHVLQKYIVKLIHDADAKNNGIVQWGVL
ncbi:hypothetical protein [Methylomonas sp. YC3]